MSYNFPTAQLAMVSTLPVSFFFFLDLLDLTECEDNITIDLYIVCQHFGRNSMGLHLYLYQAPRAPYMLTKGPYGAPNSKMFSFGLTIKYPNIFQLNISPEIQCTNAYTYTGAGWNISVSVI